jgi:hypothetical protein
MLTLLLISTSINCQVEKYYYKIAAKQYAQPLSTSK